MQHYLRAETKWRRSGASLRRLKKRGRIYRRPTSPTMVRAAKDQPRGRSCSKSVAMLPTGRSVSAGNVRAVSAVGEDVMTSTATPRGRFGTQEACPRCISRVSGFRGKERFPSADFLLALERGAKANIKP